MNSCCYLVLSLARELIDAPISAEVLTNLRPVNFNPEVINWGREAIMGYEPCPLVFPDLVRLFWKGSPAKDRWAILQKILCRNTVAGYANDSSGQSEATCTTRYA